MRTIQFVVILLLAFSCKRAEIVQADELYGKWDIIKANRNGKETGYLRGGYFVIRENGSLTVNITGEEEQSKFNMDRNKIRTDHDQVYEIESLSADSMVVTYIAASNGHFVFHMAKHKDEVQ